MTEVPLSYSGTFVSKCDNCNGTGTRSIHSPGEECLQCKGSGKVYRRRTAASLESVGAGPAPRDARLGPVLEEEGKPITLNDAQRLINAVQDQEMRELRREKARLEEELANLRKQLKG